MKPVSTFKPWEPWVRTRFESSEEGLESFIEPPQNILRTRKINLSKTLIKSTNFFKRVGLVIVINGLMPLAVADYSMFKGRIVEEPRRLKEADKFSFLSPVGKEPVFKRLSHLPFLLRSNIMPDSLLRDTANRFSIIGPAPESREPAPNFLKFLPKDSASIAFQGISYTSHGISRVGLNKQVDMVWHDFQGMDYKAKLRGSLEQELTEPACNIPYKDLKPILGAPN